MRPFLRKECRRRRQPAACAQEPTGAAVPEPRWLRALDERCDRSPRLVRGVSLGLVFLIFVLHNAVSREYHLGFFYLLPVALASRYCSCRCGLIVSLLSVTLWFAGEYSAFHPAHPLLANAAHLQVVAVNAAVYLSILASISLLVSRLESAVIHEKAIAKTKGEMLSIVSHQFANALTTMGMAMFVLEEEMGGAPSPHQRELYEVLRRNIATLKGDVENLLNGARMESGHFVVEPKPVNAVHAVRAVLSELGPAARQKSIHLEDSLPPQEPVVSVDPDAFHLILTNLVCNAIKYTPADGRVAVRLDLTGSPPLTASICVEDTGIGMSRVEIDRALQGFARAARGREMASGFGIGLKTARDMLASHGAKLSVASRRNAGSRFTFTLPLVPADQAGPTQAPRS